MKLEVGKKYKDGHGVVRILCLDGVGEQPVIGESDAGAIRRYTLDGKCFTDGDSCSYDLISEAHEWEGFNIGEPVMVRDADNAKWDRRYFAGVRDGIHYAFDCGATAWSSEGHMTDWAQCRRPTPEELEVKS